MTSGLPLPYIQTKALQVFFVVIPDPESFQMQLRVQWFYSEPIHLVHY